MREDEFKREKADLAKKGAHLARVAGGELAGAGILRHVARIPLQQHQQTEVITVRVLS